MRPDTVTLGTPTITVACRPGFGGHIVSLIFRGSELLTGGYRGATQGIENKEFSQAGLGGIDDCLPAIAPGVHPSGGPIPDHGELWYRPAEVKARSSSTLVLSMRGESLPYVLVRRFALVDGRLVVDYELANTGSEPLPVIWAAHPLSAVSEGMRIRLPAGPGKPCSPVMTHAWTAGKCAWTGRHSTCPSGTPVPTHAFVKLFAPWDGAPAALEHPALGCRISIALIGGPPAHLGVWINRQGFPREPPVTHVALEPTFESSDDLATSLAAGTRLTVEPNTSARWRVTYTAGGIV